MVGKARLELLHGHVDAEARETARSGGAISGSSNPAPTSVASTQRIRIVDGALRCVARQGVAKTTLDDVAKEAGCSRATVYRVFPGGKDGVLTAVVDTEVSRFFSSLAVRMGQASDIEEVFVAGMTEAARRVCRHGALSYLLEHEPEVVLPQLAFDQMDKLLGVSSSFLAPFLGRWLDHDEAKRVAEWATRIVLSYLACPAEGVDLNDPHSVRNLVRTFVLPGIRTARTGVGDPATRDPSTDDPSTDDHGTRKLNSGKGEAS